MTTISLNVTIEQPPTPVVDMLNDINEVNQLWNQWRIYLNKLNAMALLNDEPQMTENDIMRQLRIRFHTLKSQQQEDDRNRKRKESRERAKQKKQKQKEEEEAYQHVISVIVPQEIAKGEQLRAEWREELTAANDKLTELGKVIPFNKFENNPEVIELKTQIKRLKKSIKKPIQTSCLHKGGGTFVKREYDNSESVDTFKCNTCKQLFYEHHFSSCG